MVLTIKNFSNPVGPGITATAPTNLVGVAGVLKATITWTSATGESGVVWTEEKLVRKEGSAPQGSLDGTVVTTITTKDTYVSTGYEDTGLDSTKTYYYKVFAVYDNGTERGSSAVDVQPDDYEPTVNTALWYPLISDFNDYSGNGHNGTKSGTVNFDTVNGVSCATTTSSTSGFVSIPSPLSSGTYTISAFVNIKILPTPDNYWYSILGIGNLSISLCSRENGGGQNKFTIVVISQKDGISSFVPSINTWYHLVGTYGPNGMNLYVNGTKVYSDNQSYTISGTNGKLFSRTALTQGDYYGALSNIILEDKIWTDKEVLDYFDGKKNQYGIL